MSPNSRQLSFIIFGLIVSQSQVKGDLRPVRYRYDRAMDGSWVPLARYLIPHNQISNPNLLKSDLRAAADSGDVSRNLYIDQEIERLPPSLIQWLEARRLLQLSSENLPSLEYFGKNLEINDPSYGSESAGMSDIDQLRGFDNHEIDLSRRQLPHFTHKFIGKRPQINTDYRNAKRMPIELFSRRVPHYSHSFIGKRSDYHQSLNSEAFGVPSLQPPFHYSNSFLDRQATDFHTQGHTFDGHRLQFSSSSEPFREMMRRTGSKFSHKFIGKRSLHNESSPGLYTDKRARSFGHSFVGKRLSTAILKQDNAPSTVSETGKFTDDLDKSHEQDTLGIYGEDSEAHPDNPDMIQANSDGSNNLEKREHFSHSFIGKRAPRFGHSFVGKRNPDSDNNFVAKRPRFGHSFVGKRPSFSHSFIGKRPVFTHNFVGKRNPRFGHSFVGKRPSFGHSFVGKRPKFGHSFVGKRLSFGHSFVGKRQHFSHSFLGKRRPDLESSSVFYETGNKDLQENKNNSTVFPVYDMASADIMIPEKNNNDSSLALIEITDTNDSEDYSNFQATTNKITEKRQPSYSHKFLGKRVPEFDKKSLKFGNSFVGKRKDGGPSGVEVALGDGMEIRTENNFDELVEEEEELQNVENNEMNSKDSSKYLPKI